MFSDACIYLADHNEETQKRRSLGTSLCIIDYYQHDRPTHLKLDGPRISQYNLLQNESPMDGYTEKKLSVSIEKCDENFDLLF